MSKYVERSVEFIQLPLNSKTSLFHPERIVLIFDDGHSVDVGSLCFSDVKTGVRRRAKGFFVNIDTFQKSRTATVCLLLNYISDRFARQEFRPLTDYTHSKRVLAFIRWCYENGFSNPLTSKKDAENGLVKFAEFIRHKVFNGTLNPNTAGPMQSDAHIFCINFYRDPDFARNLRQIDKGHRFAKQTEVPDEAAISRTLALCFTFFTELVDLHLKLPHLLH